MIRTLKIVRLNIHLDVMSNLLKGHYFIKSMRYDFVNRFLCCIKNATKVYKIHHQNSTTMSKFKLQCFIIQNIKQTSITHIFKIQYFKLVTNQSISDA